MKQLLIAAILFPVCFFSQVSDKKFKVNLGYEYRITPYDFGLGEGAYISNYYYTTNRDNHLSGNSVNLELEFFLLKNTSLGLMQNFRYDELFADINLENGTTSASDMKMRLMSDTGLFLKHYLTLKNEKNAFFGLLGYGFMNNNTTFYPKYLLGQDENGNASFAISEVDFKFQSIFIGVGYKYDKFEIMLGNHFVGKASDPFREGYSEGFGMPYVKLNYNVFNF